MGFLCKRRPFFGGYDVKKSKFFSLFICLFQKNVLTLQQIFQLRTYLMMFLAVLTI